MLTEKFYEAASVYPEGDGWTLPGYFAAVPNLHGPVRFTYRPYTVLDKEVFMSIQDLAGVALAKKTAELIAPRIKSWNVRGNAKDEGGATQVAPISPHSLLNLPPALFARFLGLIIYGTHPSDTDPDWSNEDKDLQEESHLKALMAGRSVNDTAVEGLEKNS